MTDLEQDILNNYGEKGASYFAEKYNVPRTRVNYLASKFKVTNNRTSSRDKAQMHREEIIKLYESLSISDIAFKLKISWGHVKSILQDEGLYIKKAKDYADSYRLNENFFETINTPEKAYWLGFLAADGNCCGNQFCVGLAIKDFSQLEKLKARLDYSGPIKMRKKSCEISFTNKKMVGDLIANGVVRRKTFALDHNILSRIDEDLKRHFILGYIDGDGCTRISERGLILFVCGMEDLMWEIRLTIFEQTGILFSEPKTKNPEKPFCSIALRANEAKTQKLFSYFYENGSKDFLDRKKQAFIDKLENYKEDHFPLKTLQYLKSREISRLTRLIERANERLDELSKTDKFGQPISNSTL